MTEPGKAAAAGSAAGHGGDDRHPDTADLRLPKVLAALADPVRLTTVRTLAALGESPCSELHRLAELRVSRSTFSHHQRILREAGVIRERIHGPQRILTVRRADLDVCFPGLLTAVLATSAELTGTL
ncbi:ArsR/SmtB family transcription factor [Streptomyces sp. YGL11-2]|uniref:ArsR/SmtB family transcription factor n=1 Tax=Streptomyces sp. YGL11-2 TaxID=3414028 RepID=UPI003CEFEB03